MPESPQHVRRCQRKQNPDLEVELEDGVHAVDVSLDAIDVHADDDAERRERQQERERGLWGVQSRGKHDSRGSRQCKDDEREHERRRAARYLGQHQHDHQPDSA